MVGSSIFFGSCCMAIDAIDAGFRSWQHGAPAPNLSSFALEAMSNEVMWIPGF